MSKKLRLSVVTGGFLSLGPVSTVSVIEGVLSCIDAHDGAEKNSRSEVVDVVARMVAGECCRILDSEALIVVPNQQGAPMLGSRDEQGREMIG